MKTLGIIGGIGPESTIVYYRAIVAGFRERVRDGSLPPIIINSIDIKKLLDLVASDRAALTTFLSDEVERLARAGADVALFASNTPHIVFNDVQQRSRIPLLSIVDATRRAVAARGLRNPALFGIRFTMQGRFYPDEFVIPDHSDQEVIHSIYVNELLKNIFLDKSRATLTAIIERLKSMHNIDSVILGGTELPLLLTDETAAGVPLLDTSKIHAAEALEEILR